MTTDKIPIPPKHNIQLGLNVERKHHGWDVTVTIRSLNITSTLNHELEVVMVAAGELAGRLVDAGATKEFVLDGIKSYLDTMRSEKPL